MKQKSHFLASLGLLLFALLAACTPSVTETAVPPQAPSPTAEIMADCFQTVTARAWLDVNGDGVQDEGEPPLPGIEFVLEPTVYSRTTSDENGMAHIFATTPGGQCAESLSIAVSRHEGYLLTTPDHVTNIDLDQVYAFGFQAETAVSVPDLFVEGASGLDVAADWSVTAVNYLFKWIGDGWSAYEFEQIEGVNGRFIHANGRDMTSQVAQLRASLTGLEPVDEVSFVNSWTDDYPEWYVELVGENGRSVLLSSDSTGFRGHAPWYVLVDGQLYRQTSGDIGFAVYDLVSEDAQDYFTLNAPAFVEEQLEPGARSSIFYGAPDISGLLPIAANLAYGIDAASGNLQGTFVFMDYADYDTSTYPITGAQQMQITLPDGQVQLCDLQPEETEYRTTIWHFSCSLPASSLPLSVNVAVQLTTSTERVLISQGQINLSSADVK
ncbi:MAG: hypothetical protein R3E31_19625 [Chloroflexota bacterium]